MKKIWIGFVDAIQYNYNYDIVTTPGTTLRE